MTTLVTGAAGYLGSYVTDVLLDRGEKVIGLDDLAWGKVEHISRFEGDDRFVFEQLDINDTQGVTDALTKHGVDKVFHLAALHFIPAAVRNPTLAVRINVCGTQSMLDAANNAGVERLAFASTGDIYAPDDNPHQEDATPGPFNVYGLSKLQGEQLIHLASRNNDTKYFISRFFNLYGARETNPHIVPEIVEQLREGTGALRLGNLEPRRDMVPIHEAARALVDSLHAVEEGVTTANIGTGVAHKMSDVVAMLVKLAGTETAIEVDPAKMRASERMHLQADVSRLTELIGWAPSGDLELGIERLMIDEGMRN